MTKKTRSIYLDYSATTPVDYRALKAMLPYFSTMYGNASSSHHMGSIADKAVNHARAQIAAAINSRSKEIIFTSGATESNNLAIKGMQGSHKRHIITTKIEHKCVLESCKYMEKLGFTVTYLDVQKNGLIDVQVLQQAINSDTVMVAISWVHNEIGVIQPIKEIGALCKLKGIVFHVDAAQALGKVKIDVEENHIDTMSLSSHKFYGPKGVGALYIRCTGKRVKLSRIVSGGGQERGYRSGTIPVPLCVGMGVASKLSAQLFDEESSRITMLAKLFWDKLHHKLENIYINGDTVNKVPHITNISFDCVEGESLMMRLDNIYVSSGSACNSSTLESSYVLKNLQIPIELTHTSIRFSIGRYTTKNDIELAAKRVIEAVVFLRSMSPLWEMRKAGIDISSIEWKH